MLATMLVYDYLVVLCPGYSDAHGRFDVTDDAGMYVGGQIRMDAAARIAAQTDAPIILVGGDVTQHDPVQKWHKFHDMRRFLVTNGVAPQRILGIASAPNTLGNIRALYVACKALLNGARVGILTNAYHMQRTRLLLTDPQLAWNVSWLPLEAESYAAVTDGPSKHALGLRQDQEQKGIRDWRAGNYRGQTLEISHWRGDLYNQATAPTTLGSRQDESLIA